MVSERLDQQRNRSSSKKQQKTSLAILYSLWLELARSIVNICDMDIAIIVSKLVMQ